MTLAKHIKKGELILLVIFLIITPLLLTPWIQSNDGAGYFSYVRSFVIDHDLDLGDEKDYFEQDGKIASIKQDPNTSNYYSQYPFGTALMWLPYFLIGHLFAWVSNFATDGYSLPYIYAISLGSAIYAFFGIVLIYKILRKHFAKKIALLSIITMWMASNLFYYMYFEPSMSHANSFFVVTAFFYYWHKSYRNRNTNQWIMLGLLGALATLVRYQNIIFLTLPLMEILPLYIHRKIDWDAFKKHLLFTFSFSLLFLPQLILLMYQHGNILINYDGSFAISNVFTNLLKVLFSNHHGLFNWTPIIIFSVLGLIFAAKKNRKLSSYLLVIFILNLIIVAGWTVWYGGQSYGHRMFVNIIPIFAFGLAALIDRIQHKINFYYIIGICSLFIAWNFGLMIQYGSRMIDSQAAVAFGERVYNNFVNVPRKLFKILRKFIFSRGDFLK